MKLKTKHIILGIMGLFLLIGFSTQLFSNSWGLLIGNSYVIPNQSSIFTFKAVKMNKGSGNYWLYGEDQKYYYTTLEKVHIGSYALLAKEKAKSISNFDKTNYKTWFNLQVSCNDILSTYAIKPNGLEFIKCVRPKNSQIKIKATYRVNSKQSKEIENFLVENYGMGELKWACCGWDNAGKYGGFEHPEFKKIDPYCTAIISMYASGGIKDKNEWNGIKLETDRNKIDYFIVIVELVIV
ncbi:DUF4952 domain-containing protein [uncultured Aquimarina sp.]|uniref:DUF4952 domain-containing protein n=1 Tax=uncultured Aquimarina sp. TaxID=575652 RepID=UPI0026247866|nr:DUF4952 domain-containing protein [uncultured Aquimarina sp.]